ncbi:MAG: acetate--CoA ligase family protein, partial [Hyphomicrobiaceae bacterium]
PVLLVGLGGIYAEVFDDVAIGPLTDNVDVAKRQIASLKGQRLLAGVRGEDPSDIQALAELMVSLSKFAAQHGADIQEIDLNPVVVHGVGDGVSIVDALITRKAPN